MLIIERNLNETLMRRDVVIFLPQHLGFVLNIQNSQLERCTEGYNGQLNGHYLVPFRSQDEKHNRPVRKDTVKLS